MKQTNRKRKLRIPLNLISYGSNFKKFLMAWLMAMIATVSFAQAPLPFEIKNNSEYSDSEIYVAIVGEDLSSVPGKHIWVDLKTGNQYPMDKSYNTIAGPVYEGNMGPGGNGLYANCFTKLSDIPNKTVYLSQIQGGRVYFAIGQQLYFYFFGASGDPKGYTAPNHTNPTDPNTGIKFEIIEFTYDEYGYFGNPTRVDAYQYPMGLELYGHDGYAKKVGEIASHEEILAAFPNSVPVEFQGCLDTEKGIIMQPTKTKAFADGSIGTMPNPGPYVNYMKPYIDAIWEKYKNEDLIFDSGDAGIWKGRVQGEQLVMTAIEGGFIGRKGIIVRRPTTQEAFEGKGVLDNVVQDKTTDLVVQAQICAAITRHVIDVTTPNVGLQNWSDASKYYKKNPTNHYAKFWHQPGISIDQLSYGFAYDDVWDHSPSLHTPVPAKVVAVFGGYAGMDVNQSPTATITSPNNNANFVTGSNLTIQATASDSDGTVSKVTFYRGSTKIGEDASAPYAITWNNVSAGTHSLIAVATDNKGATGTSAVVTITVGNGNNNSCTGSSNNGDYTYVVSGDNTNPTITFKPARAGVGSNIIILYYGTSSTGSYPGYIVSPNTPYPINASAGQKVYFYYTYSIPKGGERNTADQRHTFTVGQCGTGSTSTSALGIRELNTELLLKSELLLFPNPARNTLSLKSLPENVTHIVIYDGAGRKKIFLRSENMQNASVDIQSLGIGLHYIKIHTASGVVTKSFIKK